jgi:signal-transduction protein with cAMP-binding, CBS, and nucleotidyltransferase domain
MTAPDPTPAALATLLVNTTVADAMRPGIVECQPDADLATVARLLATHGIHCVVVAGIERRSHGGDRLAWGIVSDLDLVGALPGTEPLSAAQLAASEIVTIDPADSLDHAARLMAEHDTHHLVVASAESGRPVGVLSTLDIARAATTVT